MVEANFHYWHPTVFHRQLPAKETGLVQAEITLPPAYGQGQGEASGLRVKITSSQTGDTTIGTCGTMMRVRQAPDGDQDGLLDSWERDGIDYDRDGTVDLALNAAPYNADPGRKDIFVELDWMRCEATSCKRPRELSDTAIKQVVHERLALGSGQAVAAFANEGGQAVGERRPRGCSVRSPACPGRRPGEGVHSGQGGMQVLVGGSGLGPGVGKRADEDVHLLGHPDGPTTCRTSTRARTPAPSSTGAGHSYGTTSCRASGGPL
ncbi:hypothetical protein [Nonomuraea jabiensis]|uniref:hypothetical protein n=1 Tax=Nonomuraea jabiensis TaxID=882448 RepID=UPI0036A8B86E